ncbi:MAG: hypothetical protein HYZ15_13665 [Sphingobacteriales bacterium]|nr:hypothetical protein [Sphingobacteriales bacterium]
MGNNKKPGTKTRRGFFTELLQGSANTSKPEMIKMLTPDGQLVEVDKAIYEKAVQKKKASNKEIFDWMNNPSKKNS